jgi:hypothetical protein
MQKFQYVDTAIFAMHVTNVLRIMDRLIYRSADKGNLILLGEGGRGGGMNNGRTIK